MLTLNSISNHPIVHVEAALSDAQSGRYQLSRIEKHVSGALLSTDGYIDTVEIIGRDTEGSDVSAQGHSLAKMAGRAKSEAGKANKNQSGAGRSFVWAMSSIDEALTSSLSAQDREDLEAARLLLNQRDDLHKIEAALSNTVNSLGTEAKPHLDVVKADRDGQDVSARATPLESLFSNSVTKLESVQLHSEKSEVEEAIALLEDVRSRLEP